jgi:DNA-binding transcriptional MocR family regulator
MNAPVQQALSHWLARRGGIQSQIRARMRMNLAVLEERLHGSSAQMLAMQGGWTVMLRVPREIDGKKFCFAALDRGVIVQPGEFYGLPEGRAVLSLLTPPEIWREGLAKLLVD